MREKDELVVIVEMLTRSMSELILLNSTNDTSINGDSAILVLRLLNAAYDYELKKINMEKSSYRDVDHEYKNRLYCVSGSSKGCDEENQNFF